MPQLEPLPSAQMYVDAWAEATQDPGTNAVLSLRLLPTRKRLAVLEAWIGRAEAILADPVQASRPWMKPSTLNDELLPQLKRELEQLRSELARHADARRSTSGGERF